MDFLLRRRSKRHHHPHPKYAVIISLNAHADAAGPNRHRCVPSGPRDPSTGRELLNAAANSSGATEKP